MVLDLYICSFPVGIRGLIDGNLDAHVGSNRTIMLLTTFFLNKVSPVKI